MDSRVEKLENEVNSLTAGQLQILENLNELSLQFNSQTNPRLEQEREGSNSPLRNPTKQPRHTNGSQYGPRFVKLDFPRFNGEEDTTSWFCRVEQFFDFNHTAEEDRVALASFHLEGDAQLWYQLIKQEKGVMTWQEFCDGLNLRFGVSKFQDFFGDLIKLQQMGFVCDYQTQFERLLSKVGYLPQNRQISCFISGLKDSIKADVLAGCPTSLSAATGLVRLYEARNLAQRRGLPTLDVKKNFPANNEGLIRKPTLPVRRMSQAELQQRRAKGLYYNCNEKFVPGHRCKRLFLIEACYEEDDGDVIMDLDENTHEASNEIPGISLHAISGARASDTMCIKGRVGNIATSVLIDSGSTHNFMSENLARKVGLQSENGGKFEVLVASGEKLVSSGKCTNVKLMLQGIPVFVDFYLLQLEGYDIVLGTQWLRTLDPIWWDFASLSMKLKLGDQEIVFQGESIPDDQLVGDLKFNCEARKRKKAVLLQIFSLGTPLSKLESDYKSPQLQQLLIEFQDVFDEPKGLPPQHNHDHKIPLVAGSVPVCVKPYRYPYYQKAEIERLVTDMLTSGVIKPSNSLYSSPFIVA